MYQAFLTNSSMQEAILAKFRFCSSRSQYDMKEIRFVVDINPQNHNFVCHSLTEFIMRMFCILSLYCKWKLLVSLLHIRSVWTVRGKIWEISLKLTPELILPPCLFPISLYFFYASFIPLCLLLIIQCEWSTDWSIRSSWQHVGLQHTIMSMWNVPGKFHEVPSCLFEGYFTVQKRMNGDK